MPDPSRPVDSPGSFDGESRHLVDEAAAGIRRSRSVVARTTKFLQIARRFLLGSRGSAAAARRELPWHGPDTDQASGDVDEGLRALDRLFTSTDVRPPDETNDVASQTKRLERLAMELQRRALAQRPD